MNFNLHRPCPNCPFRRDVAFCLTRARRSEIAASLLFGDQTFACHKTVDYVAWEEAREAVNEDGGDVAVAYPHQGDEEHCAGALIVMAKSNMLFANYLFRLAALSKIFEPDKLDMNSPVFEDLDRFVENAP